MSPARIARSQLVCGLVALLALLTAAGCGGSKGGETPTTVFGRQARELAVGIATQRDGTKVSVAATVLGQDGAGRNDLDVDLSRPGGRWTGSELCGDGEYCGGLEVTGARPVVRVRVLRPAGRQSTVHVLLPQNPRPALAASLVRACALAVRGLQSLIIHEYLDSGPRYDPLRSEFMYVAPDRLAYQTVGAGAAIVIGSRRWDRERVGGPWLESKQEPLRVPAPDWRRARDASVLGSGKRDGRPIWRVSFYDPTTPAWFEVEIDKETNLPLWLEMIAAAHFMTHTFYAFNAPLTILPPA